MPVDFDFNRLLDGKVLALDRSALPALAAAAQMQWAAAPAHRADLQRHALDWSRPVAVRRVGNAAIVSLTGLITADAFLRWLTDGTHPDALLQALREAVADTTVQRVVLLVDSPGGEVALIPETAAEIRRLRSVKPITAIARPVMASAAYWLASQASTIVATPSADVGAVGVFSMHVSVQRLEDAAGIDVTHISSSPEKTELSPHLQLSDEAFTFQKRHILQVESRFIADIAAGRGISAATVRAKFGNGRTFGADEARDRGMVDSVRTIDELLTVGAGRTSVGLSARRATDSDDDQHAADEVAMILALTAGAAPDRAAEDDIAMILALTAETE